MDQILIQGMAVEDFISKVRAIVKEELNFHKPEEPKAPEGMLTRKEAKAALKVSYPTMNKLVKSGKLPAKRIGKRIYFSPEAVANTFQDVVLSK